MKQTWERSIKIILSSLLLCMAFTVFMPGIRSEAATKKPTCAKSQTVYIGQYESPYEPLGYSGWIFISNLSSNAKITNVKSSNKKILCSNRGNYISLQGGKNAIGAKTKITFKVKQNKKTYSLSCNVTFKKAASPFKSLSLGGKEYAKKFGANVDLMWKVSHKKAKISVKMNSGKKLKGITLNNKKIKNGSKVALKTGDVLVIEYTYTKPKNVPKTKEWKNFECTNYMRIYVE